MSYGEMEQQYTAALQKLIELQKKIWIGLHGNAESAKETGGISGGYAFIRGIQHWEKFPDQCNAWK